MMICWKERAVSTGSYTIPSFQNPDQVSSSTEHSLDYTEISPFAKLNTLFSFYSSLGNKEFIRTVPGVWDDLGL